MVKKVFVSGCYDLLHSGHVEFFRQAAEYGDLYVGIGSDATILDYKHHKTGYSEQERLFMVKSIRYVKDAFINAGRGVMDFVPTLDLVHPDILVVNSDGVLAWKLTGAGGGGYLACVVTDASSFAAKHAEAISITIRRPGDF